MARKIKLTMPQRVALEMYAGVRGHAYVSSMTVDLLQRKALIERSERGAWVLTDRGRMAVDTGYIPA